MSLLFFFKSHYTRHPTSTLDYGLHRQASKPKRRKKRRIDEEEDRVIPEVVAAASVEKQVVTKKDFSVQNFMLIEEHNDDF